MPTSDGLVPKSIFCDPIIVRSSGCVDAAGGTPVYRVLILGTLGTKIETRIMGIENESL